MKLCLVLFPHQLFEEAPIFQDVEEVFLIEEYLFFRQFSFHKQKLVFHRSSMKCFSDSLKKRGIHVTYIDSTEVHSEVQSFFRTYHTSQTQWRMVDPVDDWLSRRIKKVLAELNAQYQWLESPNFIQSSQENRKFQDPRKTYFQTDYYQHFRKKNGYLMMDDGKPIGGKYSFDSDNRKAYKGEVVVPEVIFPKADEYVMEARNYVKRNYSTHPGSLFWDEHCFYPIRRADARVWMHDFFKQRFQWFGDYEDAIVTDVGKDFLFHSVLSPLINVGLLSPTEVIEESLFWATGNAVPLNSLEGFIRQISGWREFIRHVYEDQGGIQRTRNFWGFTRKIPSSFYTGHTGIEPVDFAIKKVLKLGYNHHIERLMVLGNFMLLCEFDPDEVYRWFMEMYVDAYDWVMVPNVYGMICFADGGIMTSKPYLSGSNYLMKMGVFSKSKSEDSWQTTWDGLFWRFMSKHRAFFSSNPRLGMLLRTWDNMAIEKQNQHLNAAESFLRLLDRSHENT